MNAQRFKLVTETIGLVTIVATLIVLILEVRGNTTALEAATRQGFATQDQVYLQTVLDSSVIARADAKLQNGQELTPLESSQLMHRQHLNFRIFEHAYFQYQQGTLERSEWLRYENIVSIVLANEAAARQMWERFGGGFTPEFSAIVEGMLME